MKKIILQFLISILSIVTLVAQESQWESLLDKKLSKWDAFIGVPHYTVKGIDNTPKGDGREGVPMGLNNDPLKVFYAEDVDGETILRVSGEIYGGLTSKEIYGNYHLKLDVKWGELKWEPRLKDKRDSGLLYHCNGPHGVFWNVWMQSQEFQIQQGDMGDYFGLAGGTNNINSQKREDGFYVYNSKANAVKLGGVSGEKMYRCVKEFDNEKPHGEWNTLELICYNGKSYHIVNGKVVMILNRAENKLDNNYVPVTSGKIQLQSEAAGVYYRRIKLKKIDKLPAFLN